MSAPTRAVRDCLRGASIARRRHIEIILAELNIANDALLTAASGLSVALKQGMAEHLDVCELRRVIHLRLKQTIAESVHAALAEGVVI